MTELLEHPGVQAGVAPLIAGLVVAFAAYRWRFAWLAIVAASATAIALTTGFDVEPLTAGRKIMFLTLAAPVFGWIADHMAPKRSVRVLVPIAAGLATWWVFATVLAQKELLPRTGLSLLLAATVAAIVAAVDAVRHDGLRTSAVGIGLGLGVGIAAVLSASIGFMTGGIALATGSGAVALMQVVMRREVVPGYVGALSIALPAAFFAAGTFMIAELPWYAFVLVPLVPLAAVLPKHRRKSNFLHGLVLLAYVVVAALLPIAAAWLATRGG